MRTFNLADLFEVVADTVPDREALVAGPRRLTYGDLDQRANRVAHHLQSVGIEPGDHVGIHAYNCAEWLEAMLGCFKARAVPINVNYRYVEDELRYLFDNADLVALIVAREFCGQVAAVLPDVPRLRHFVIIDDGQHAGARDSTTLPASVEYSAVEYEAALAAASPQRDFAPRSPDDHYILYTGGTTGLPKGTVWRAEDIFFAALGGGSIGGPPIGHPDELAEKVAASGPLVFLVTPPMMHGGGQWISYIGLYAGATIVMYTERRYDADAVWRLAERERANTVMVVGDAMARPLADALAREGASYDLSSVVTVASGGAILSPPVKEQLRSLLPNALVMDSFGASETGANGTVLDVGAPAAGPRFTMGEHTTVLDDELRRVSPGSDVVGRLARTGHIPLGYYKDDEKTAATFLADAEGRRWVVPGDFARVDADGTIVVLGRGSVCINTGGEKVFPEEVEAVLKAHPSVYDAVVVGVPDTRFGERVAAIVQPRPGNTPTLEELAGHCRTKLAGYKAPRDVVVLDEIVRTPAGKPDYRWARATAQKSLAQ